MGEIEKLIKESIVKDIIKISMETDESPDSIAIWVCMMLLSLVFTQNDKDYCEEITREIFETAYNRSREFMKKMDEEINSETNKA